MRKIVALLLLVCILLSFTCCSVDIDNDGKNDSTTSLFTHTLRFVTNGGSYISPKQINVLTSAPQPTKNSHEFLGWYRDESLTVPVIYPLSIDADMTIYAKWLKLADSMQCANTNIKFLNDIGSAKTCAITPTGFDLEELSLRGYYIDIVVQYDVYYVKDYDILWDIGYMGSPKYEVSILNDDGVGQFQHDLTTTTSAKTRTIKYTARAINYSNSVIYLTFSTDNIQNIIYFKNITVSYTCHK